MYLEKEYHLRARIIASIASDTIIRLQLSPRTFSINYNNIF